MHALLLCVAAAAVGDVGWQRMPEGGMQYIIQLDPQTLEALRAGEALESDIPPSAGDVRSYRIVVGAKKLPREAPPAPRAITPDVGKPLSVHTTDFTETIAAAAKPQPKPPAAVSSEEPAKPWLPLIFTLLGLFFSLAANVFLGWTAWGFRQRLMLRNAAA
jgi:hypothetical protein